ncbi:nuclear transport factor 2 family protein [Flagellimonas lutimaris]|uniref:nuclear transport factor 2 family protein n=1 Tax=Flagellimonas lutimaris TaxID=475082 RepID=UPI003F5CF944
MFSDKEDKIKEVIKIYMDGLFQGDTDKLRKAFAPKSYLFGDIKGEPYNKSLDDYLEGVGNRKSPSELNEPFKMDILAVEILGHVAIAKLHVPMLGFNYYDFLSLTMINGEWKIVNKLFTHVSDKEI